MLLRLGLVLACALVACASDSDESTDEISRADTATDALTIANDTTNVPFKDERSLVVTSPAGISDVAKRFSFGKLMETMGDAARTVGAMGLDDEHQPVPNKAGASDDTPNAWVDHVFGAAAKEFDDHTKAPKEARLGIAPVENPLQHLRDLWSGKNGTLDSKKAVSLGDGPFRLLAVLNRLDIAGDVDSRDCCTGAARIARPFGEGRLVFGLVDPEMEGRKNPKAYPLTVIIEFRLPALGPQLNMMGDDYDYKGALTNDAEWRTQMERWGKVWQEQSRLAPSDPKFQARLAQIVARFAKPQNFLSIRSGFQVEDAKGNTEFEYREWYILRSSTHLIPRKPRREPYRCGSDGTTLTDIVESQWNDNKNDLEMRGVNANGRSISYDMPRDDGTGLIDQRGPMKGCARDAKGKGIPFEMNGDAPGDGSERNIDDAPFARFAKDDVWKLTGQNGDLAKKEDVRHAFAIRTCSGCHGKEAGLFGFQISPRLEKEESKLADFMTGKGGNQFTHGNVSYHYDDLADRRSIVTRAAKRDASLTIYDGLWRTHDRAH